MIICCGTYRYYRLKPRSDGSITYLCVNTKSSVCLLSCNGGGGGEGERGGEEGGGEEEGGGGGEVGEGGGGEVGEGGGGGEEGGGRETITTVCWISCVPF